MQLLERWRKFVALRGDYFEGTLFFYFLCICSCSLNTVPLLFDLICFHISFSPFAFTSEIFGCSCVVAECVSRVQHIGCSREAIWRFSTSNIWTAFNPGCAEQEYRVCLQPGTWCGVAITGQFWKASAALNFVMITLRILVQRCWVSIWWSNETMNCIMIISDSCLEGLGVKFCWDMKPWVLCDKTL